jgi:hypothetical protein
MNSDSDPMMGPSESFFLFTKRSQLGDNRRRKFFQCSRPYSAVAHKRFWPNVSTLEIWRRAADLGGRGAALARKRRRPRSP